MDPFDAQPDKGGSAGGWEVHLGDEVEGGQDIGNVIQTPHLGLELVDVLRWLISTYIGELASADNIGQLAAAVMTDFSHDQRCSPVLMEGLWQLTRYADAEQLGSRATWAVLLDSIVMHQTS